jgi:endonuclease/exonuclease/phosphatase family metal-dependent hydrolase
LYNYYSNYGKVIIAGDFNGSLLDTCNTNLTKRYLLSDFVSRCNLCFQNKHFVSEGEPFSLIQKKTTLDYILFEKHALECLISYRSFEEGSISNTSDHLPISCF